MIIIVQNSDHFYSYRMPERLTSHLLGLCKEYPSKPLPYMWKSKFKKVHIISFVPAPLQSMENAFLEQK